MITKDDKATVMGLAEALAARRRAIREALAMHERRVLEDAVERLEMLQIAEHGLAVGDQLPDLALPDAAGAIVTGDALLAGGPLAVAFFRGGWCPYCELAMGAYEAVRPRLAEIGAGLVGIAPETPERLAVITAERGLGYPLLSDRGGHYAALCGLNYAMSEGQIDYYAARGHDFPALQGAADWQLAVPATYVVASDGRIVFAHVDPDWTRRAEPELLVAAVQALTTG